MGRDSRSVWCALFVAATIAGQGCGSGGEAGPGADDARVAADAGDAAIPGDLDAARADAAGMDAVTVPDAAAGDAVAPPRDVSVADAPTGNAPPPEVFGPEPSPTTLARTITSRYLGFNPGHSRGPWADRMFGTMRLWDSGTAWCDIQPDAGADMVANLDQKMKPYLDAAVAAGITRVVIVLGHPAPWVYGGATAAERDPGVWFCGGTKSSVSLPSAAFLGTSRNLGPGWTRWANYVSTVIRYLSSRYPQRFEVDLQSWNEPTIPSGWRSWGVANTATTASEAAASLASYDAIVRWYIDNTPGLTIRFKLLSASLTPGSATGFRGAYLAEMNSHAGNYNGLSLQSYSDPVGVDGAAFTALDRATITSDWYATAAGMMATLAAQANLGSKPVYQTETNQSFTVTSAGRSLNHNMAAADRQFLTSRMLFDGLRLGLAGQDIYAWGATDQYGPQLDASGSAASVATLTTLRVVHDWIGGQSFRGCARANGVVTCSFSAPGSTTVSSKVIYSVRSDGAPVPIAPVTGNVYSSLTGARVGSSLSVATTTPMMVRLGP